MVVVEAPHHCECMINGPVGARLGNGMGWEYLERSGGQFEPEDKTREIIQGHLLPVKLLLGEVFPIWHEASTHTNEGLTS